MQPSTHFFHQEGTARRILGYPGRDVHVCDAHVHATTRAYGLAVDLCERPAAFTGRAHARERTIADRIVMLLVCWSPFFRRFSRLAHRAHFRHGNALHSSFLMLDKLPEHLKTLRRKRALQSGDGLRNDPVPVRYHVLIGWLILVLLEESGVLRIEDRQDA